MQYSIHSLFKAYVPSVFMFLRMYVPPCVSTSVCMSLHVNSPPYVCPRCVCSSGCMFIRVYPSVYMALPLRMHIPSVYLCPLRVYVPPCVCPFRMYVPSISMFVFLVVSSFVYRLHVYVPPCVRPSFCIFLPCVLWWGGGRA